ncbi:MAG: bifunctional diguanylate cyclase/phosphodiesterase [Acidiferrobacter sp.]
MTQSLGTLNQTHFPLLYLKDDFTVAAINHAAEELLDQSAATLVGQSVATTLPGYDVNTSDLADTRAIVTIAAKDRKDQLVVEVRASRTYGPGAIRFVLLLRDLGRDRDSPTQDARLARSYQALSALNAAIRHARDETQLLTMTCRLAVDLGGFTMAWIGISADGSGEIRPVAQYGSGLAYLDGIRISADPDKIEGRGPVGVAFREGWPVVITDFQGDDSTRAWRDRATDAGLNSSCSLQITRGDAPFAVLSVYHTHKAAFDKDTVGVLRDMTHTVSFALDSLDHERERLAAQEALGDRERHFRAYFEQAAIGMAATSPEGRWIEVNNAMCSMLGYTHDELLTHTCDDVAHPDDWADSLKLLQKLQRGSLDATTCDIRYLHKDGHTIYVHVALRAVRRADRGLDYIVMLLEDVSASKRHEDTLRRLARILDESSDEIYMFDARSYRFLVVNRGAQRNLGYSAEELYALSPLDLNPGLSPEEFARLIGSLGNPDASHTKLEGEHRRKDGTIYSIEARLHLSLTDEVPAVVAIVQDTTERRRLEERLRHQATHDILTGLPNWILLHDVLDKAMANARRQSTLTAIMFIDLDDFKNINDSLGHEYGDRLLQEVAKRLIGALRHEDWVARRDDLVARQGGDEFTVLLQNLSSIDDISRIAERVLTAIAEPLSIQDRTAYMTASIGITVYPFDDTDSDGLLRNADVAMYKAKEAGGGGFTFYAAAMSARISERRTTEDGLRLALERAQFLLYYQPQISLRTNRIVGAEALIRWQHPEHGLVAPNQFIRVAEESGLIVPIGEWVLLTACTQGRIWQERGLQGLRISLNLSGRQFRDRNFIATVDRILNCTGFDPATNALELEVTESTLMDDMTTAAETLAAFRATGLRVALDDFGTGYSSLNYLKRFKIDTLKIDQSFVRGIICNPEDAAIASAIITLGHSLGLTVIAEGVETKDQLELLRKAGCDEAQGYYYSKPLPAPIFEEWLRTYRPNL